ncbi:endonuclease [Marinicella litoralis]|uniref:Lamin tail-like protein n=1 Tax=Marinicella litoralis TaxID=644220 RepID=A0A4R6XC48_9GAMM|nr:endonuclease [Marinicella litoralis]TDR16822.1 lamin tail-like protein [Marinicella litoralis]
MKKISTLMLCIGMAFSAQSGVEDLLISEISIIPNSNEFIEIYNNGNDPIDLSDVYLTDATFSGDGTYYYQIVNGGGGGGGFSDFFARFPAGATINAGEYQTVAIAGSNSFFTAYGENPTYELYEDGTADAIADMREAFAGSINGQGNLTDNSGEVVVLFSWDGVTDLVQDLDYVVWGDKVEAIDKTSVAIDGPDADSDTSTYLNDTSIANQVVISTSTHNSGNSWQRIDLSEGGEIQSGGNGFAGSDETSENTDFTFGEGMPTPNAASNITPPIAQFVINEIDTISVAADFIELLGNPNTSTDGYTLVLYDGDTDLSTSVISLNSMTTDTNGYLLINNELQDGADAVALYAADSINYMTGDPITYTDLMDAVVYGSGPPDTELLTLLNPGQLQVDEDANGNATNESLIRCTNGSGGQLNTSSFKAFTPSPGTENINCVTLDGYYDSADTSNAQTLRDSLHNIIDDHIVFPYSSGAEDTWDVLSYADQAPTTDDCPTNDPSEVIEYVWMVYKNNDYCYQGGGQQAYNREHTWPQSRGFSSGSLGDNNAARTDTHHLMLSDVGYNGDRGNLYFDNCNAQCNERPTDTHDDPNTPEVDTIGGGSGVYPGNSNWFDADSFEVWNFRKGDIARAMFYMDVRYSGDAIDEVDLVLTDDTNLLANNNGYGPYMGLLSTLLQWHAADPVDDIERNRNNYIFTKQENRNPFIDHPEWVECIFVDGGACYTADNDLIFGNGFEAPQP